MCFYLIREDTHTHASVKLHVQMSAKSFWICKHEAYLHRRERHFVYIKQLNIFKLLRIRPAAFHFYVFSADRSLNRFFCRDGCGPKCFFFIIKRNIHLFDNVRKAKFVFVAPDCWFRKLAASST